MPCSRSVYDPDTIGLHIARISDIGLPQSSAQPIELFDGTCAQAYTWRQLEAIVSDDIATQELAARPHELRPIRAIEHEIIDHERQLRQVIQQQRHQRAPDAIDGRSKRVIKTRYQTKLSAYRAEQSGISRLESTISDLKVELQATINATALLRRDHRNKNHKPTEETDIEPIY